AAHLLRNPGERDRGRVVGLGQALEETLDRAAVVRDQLALPAPFLGATEWVERSPAQELEPGEKPEGTPHPGSVAGLDRTSLGIVLGQQRRREMEAHAEVALERLLQLLFERTAGV